jgi:hypothetical protein
LVESFRCEYVHASTVPSTVAKIVAERCK